MSKPIIAVDVDDVLKESSQLVVDYSNQKWGTNLTIEDYTEHWGEMWQLDNAETYKRGEEIHREGVLVRGRPFNETRRVLESLSSHYELVVTTSRQQLISKDTKEWISKNFGDIFADVHFAGIWDDVNVDGHLKAKATKAALLQKIGAAYLIDDHPKHCFAAAELGIETLLFGNYPWNQMSKLPKGVTRAKDWKAVEEYFRERTA